MSLLDEGNFHKKRNNLIWISIIFLAISFELISPEHFIAKGFTFDFGKWFWIILALWVYYFWVFRATFNKYQKSEWFKAYNEYGFAQIANDIMVSEKVKNKVIENTKRKFSDIDAQHEHMFYYSDNVVKETILQEFRSHGTISKIKDRVFTFDFEINLELSQLNKFKDASNKSLFKHSKKYNTPVKVHIKDFYDRDSLFRIPGIDPLSENRVTFGDFFFKLDKLKLRFLRKDPLTPELLAPVIAVFFVGVRALYLFGIFICTYIKGLDL